MQGSALAPIRLQHFALSASLLLFACQSQAERASPPHPEPRPLSKAESKAEPELEATPEPPANPPDSKPISPAPELARTQAPILDAEAILEREARNERLRARRYAAAVERAQSEDLAGQAISAVRSYREALTFAPDPGARAEITLRVRSLMEQALLRDQAEALAKDLARDLARDQQSASATENSTVFVDARLEPTAESTAEPRPKTKAETKAEPVGLADLPPLPDYRGLNEDQLDQICAFSGPAARIHKAMGGASSFIGQAQALLGPGLSAKVLAHERYEAFKAGEALLASHQSLKRELEERLSYAEFRRWDEAWIAGASAQGLTKPRRIERVQLVERAGQLCDELVASIRFLSWTSISQRDRFGRRIQGFRLQTRTPNPVELQTARVHCTRLIEGALRQRKGSGLTIVESQSHAMFQAYSEALDGATRHQRHFELGDLLATLEGTALP